MKTLTASDRSALIRLASSLPKGSEERRAILAGLKQAADDPHPFGERDKVFVQLDPYRAPTVWKGEVTLHDAREMDKHLNALYEMVEEGDMGRFEEIDEEIEALEKEKERLVQKYRIPVTCAKSIGIWDHYEKGGSGMIPVVFKDPSDKTDDNWYQLVDGAVERY